MSQQLLTVKEFASLVRRDSRTVRRWIARGHIKAFKVGGKTVGIHPSQLEK